MSEANANACVCSTGPTLIFACSGGADVGAVADQAARQLTRDGKGKMYCLAGVGGRISAIMANTQGAGKILAIDGCPVNCAKASLEQAGITNFRHVQLADAGLAKGQTPPTPQNVAKAAEVAAAALAG